MLCWKKKKKADQHLTICYQIVSVTKAQNNFNALISTACWCPGLITGINIIPGALTSRWEGVAKKGRESLSQMHSNTPEDTAVVDVPTHRARDGHWAEGEFTESEKYCWATHVRTRTLFKVQHWKAYSLFVCVFCRATVVGAVTCDCRVGDQLKNNPVHWFTTAKSKWFNGKKGQTVKRKVKGNLKAQWVKMRQRLVVGKGTVNRSIQEC